MSLRRGKKRQKVFPPSCLRPRLPDNTPPDHRNLHSGGPIPGVHRYCFNGAESSIFVRLEVCDAWPVRRQTKVTFPAAGHHRPSTGTELYRFFHMYVNNLPEVLVVCKRNGRESNSPHFSHKSDALTIPSPGHTFIYFFICLPKCNVEYSQ